MSGGAAMMGLSGAGVEAQLVSLLERLEERETGGIGADYMGATASQSMMTEVRTLDLWRAVIAECLATVLYVFLVCGAYTPWVGLTVAQEPEARIVVALVAGLAMAVLVHSFGQVSGGHLNPAVSVGLAVIRKVSPLRAAMFVLAQLGGAIAGAALLYGATSSGMTGELGATALSGAISVWQGLALEFLLTVVVVFVFLSSVLPYERGSRYVVHNQTRPGVTIGLAYLTATLVGFPLTGASMNPARSLGPAFVMNKWDSHWIYWVAPILGGVTSSLIYEYIFNPHRISSSRKDSIDGDSSSVGSEEDTYDASCTKPAPAPPARYHYNALRPIVSNQLQYRPPTSSSNRNTTANSPLGYSQVALYGGSQAPSTYKLHTDDIYSGSKSLYAQSPPLPRSTSLNRSQSVYTRPTPPRTDYPRPPSSAKSGSGPPASTTPFSALLQQQQQENSKNNARRETLYVTSQPGLVKPEPVYGIGIYSKQHHHHHPDSGDSSYSTYRGSGSYSSSRSSGGGGGGQTSQPPVPASRSQHRSDSHTPNSVVSGHSLSSYHSPNPQY